MRMHTRAIPLVLLLAVLPACQTEGVEEEDAAAGQEMATADTMAAGQDTAAVREAVDKLRQQWQDAANADSAAAVAAHYTRDAEYYSPAENARGRQAIQEMFARTFPQASGLEITSDALQVSGDVAYGNGTFTQTVTMNGQEQSVEGHWLAVLRRQPDGGWLIHRHASITPMPGDTTGGAGGGAGAPGGNPDGR